MSLLLYILKGLAIGLLVSVPVGPIGVLCIQRTLNKGKWHGIVSGLGATTSDLVYSLIAAFCLSFVEAFIEEHRIVIQLVASFVVLSFGFYIFNSNPVRQLSVQKKGKNSFWGDYVSAFALCITNPLILFLFIGLFARFSFFAPHDTFWQTLIGLLAILSGAFLWWLALNSLVDIFRKKINVRGLWLVNKLTGSVIIILAIVGVVYTFLS